MPFAKFKIGVAGCMVQITRQEANLCLGLTLRRWLCIFIGAMERFGPGRHVTLGCSVLSRQEIGAREVPNGIMDQKQFVQCVTTSIANHNGTRLWGVSPKHEGSL